MKEFDTLAIVDILFDVGRRAVGHALLSRVHQLALAEKVDLAVTMLSEHSPFLRVLRYGSFIKSPKEFTLIVHEPKSGRHRLATRPLSDWHVTWSFTSPALLPTPPTKPGSSR
jgi:hypothetical protein